MDLLTCILEGICKLCVVGIRLLLPLRDANSHANDNGNDDDGSNANPDFLGPVSRVPQGS